VAYERVKPNYLFLKQAGIQILVRIKKKQRKTPHFEELLAVHVRIIHLITL
jgi:hypothetical protein